MAFGMGKDFSIVFTVKDKKIKIKNRDAPLLIVLLSFGDFFKFFFFFFYSFLFLVQTVLFFKLQPLLKLKLLYYLK